MITDEMIVTDKRRGYDALEERYYGISNIGFLVFVGLCKGG